MAGHHAKRPRSAFPQVKGRFHAEWRVMDSNQRRTTPTVLQGDVTTTAHLLVLVARVLLPRVFPAPDRTPSGDRRGRLDRLWMSPLVEAM
jgi:hypothetical protein